MVTSRKTKRRRAMSQTDEEIMEQFCATKEAIFLEELIRRYEHDLYNYLRRYLGDSQLAEDVFQSTFLQIFLKCDQFNTNRRFRPWLYMVATNQAIDIQRRNKRHKHASLEKSILPMEGNLENISLLDILPGDIAPPEDEMVLEERARRIRECVDRLAEPLRQVIMLIYYEGMKYRDVAQILGIPVGTVKSRLHTAVKKLGLWIRGVEDL
ncbi:MAG: RNA polymerase sigma factor [Planctomycetia bacterium]|nr:RNA polymerase sigma factor [Planctomycetia bacterium]